MTAATVYVNDLPRGAIIDFYGKLSEVPAGWFLCDGKNGTPNLVGKFVRGCAEDKDLGGVSGYDRTQVPTLLIRTNMRMGRGGSGWADSNKTGSYYTECQEALNKETTSVTLTNSISGNDSPSTNHPPCVMLLKIMKA